MSDFATPPVHPGADDFGRARALSMIGEADTLTDQAIVQWTITRSVA
jgi:hypothetical protein